MVLEDGSLKLIRVMTIDAGQYKCTLENQEGTVHTFINLRVDSPTGRYFLLTSELTALQVDLLTSSSFTLHKFNLFSFYFGNDRLLQSDVLTLCNV